MGRTIFRAIASKLGDGPMRNHLKRIFGKREIKRVGKSGYTCCYCRIKHVEILKKECGTWEWEKSVGILAETFIKLIFQLFCAKKRGNRDTCLTSFICILHFRLSFQASNLDTCVTSRRRRTTWGGWRGGRRRRHRNCPEIQKKKITNEQKA